MNRIKIAVQIEADMRSRDFRYTNSSWPNTVGQFPVEDDSGLTARNKQQVYRTAVMGQIGCLSHPLRLTAVNLRADITMSLYFPGAQIG